MVALATQTHTDFHELTGARDILAAFLRQREGSVMIRVIRELTDDQRRAAAAAAVTYEQLAMLQRDSEPTD